jgi:hypothetical protein
VHAELAEQVAGVGVDAMHADFEAEFNTSNLPKIGL